MSGAVAALDYFKVPASAKPAKGTKRVLTITAS